MWKGPRRNSERGLCRHHRAHNVGARTCSLMTFIPESTSLVVWRGTRVSGIAGADDPGGRESSARVWARTLMRSSLTVITLPCRPLSLRETKPMSGIKARMTATPPMQEGPICARQNTHASRPRREGRKEREEATRTSCHNSTRATMI